MDGMEKFRQFFSEDSPTFGKKIVHSQANIDGQYVAGNLDYFLRARGLSPEDMGVSKDAIQYRKGQEVLMKTQKPLPEIQDTKEIIQEENVDAGLVASVIDQLMRPYAESMSQLVAKLSEAVEHIATSQDAIRNRMEALERQMRLQQPVSERQEKYLKDAARDKARELLDKKGVSDRKAVGKLAGMIRKSILARYGFSSMREIPSCEYSVAMKQIETWNNVVAVMDIAKEARARAEANHENADG